MPTIYEALIGVPVNRGVRVYYSGNMVFKGNRDIIGEQGMLKLFWVEQGNRLIYFRGTREQAPLDYRASLMHWLNE